MMRTANQFSEEGARTAGVNRSASPGFTLLEVTIAMGIFAVAIVGVLLMLVAAEAMQQEAKNLTQAVQDARTILERVRRDVEINANMATFENNFPDWTYEAWAQEQRAAATEFVDLQDEIIDVTYGNAGDDPLDVSVEVLWVDRGGRQRTMTLQTQLTDRTGG